MDVNLSILLDDATPDIDDLIDSLEIAFDANNTYLESK